MDTALTVLINSQKEMRMDIRDLTKSIKRSHVDISDRLGNVEEWKAEHIGFDRGVERRETNSITKTTVITIVVTTVITACGFFWALKPENKQPITHAILKSIVQEVIKDKITGH